MIFQWLRNGAQSIQQGLERARSTFQSHLKDLLSKRSIDADFLRALEKELLEADFGVTATRQLLAALQKEATHRKLTDAESLWPVLKELLLSLLTPVAKPWSGPIQQPTTILMVGANGSGKTTSIAKLALYFKEQGLKPLLAAGDTFRAAAIEQLQIWAERHEVPCIAQAPGADSAAVIFDALQSAKTKSIDVVLADTAGRLHTQVPLMEELKKIVRILKKIDDTAPQEVWLVLDAHLGQNALQQAKRFQEDLHISGLIVTKLDGTAKGGILFQIAETLKIPIYFIGIGEGGHDLRPFDAHAFVGALLESSAN